ncbi:hypothetical protein BDQ12DRAFT_682550 [Crucibulum laeve]|uniref:Uncharacterized protein n=1 Tax=Crucibulum laeve TaxID=68775 RepID=A0A5C3M3G0_9AGAR|nr:hypothetical protein BDQ12DRAFT_682550 [Crucibulum laeve]
MLGQWRMVTMARILHFSFTFSLFLLYYLDDLWDSSNMVVLLRAVFFLDWLDIFSHHYHQISLLRGFDLILGFLIYFSVRCWWLDGDREYYAWMRISFCGRRRVSRLQEGSIG